MPKDEKQRNDIPNKKKGKSLLILSAVTALFIGVMGYEIVRENVPKNLKTTDENKLLISRNKGLYEKTEKINLNLLKAENRHFSSKIIALKEEAHANRKRLHDLQISMLSAKQSKENKEISTLKEELKKEEQLNLSLDDMLERLKSDIQNKEEQIQKDQVSMLSLNNSHRQLEIKLGTLHNQSSDEKEDLVKTIYQLESAHTMLKMEMQEHLVQIQNLETSKETALAEKLRLTNLVSELENSETLLKDANKEYLAQIEKREAEIEKQEDLNGRLSLIALDKELEADGFKEGYQAEKLIAKSDATNLSMVIETEQLASHLFQRELHYHASELASAKELLKNSETLLENLAQEKAKQDRQFEFFIQEIDEKNEMLSLNKRLFEELDMQSYETNEDLKLSLAKQQQNTMEYTVGQLHDLYINEQLSLVLFNDLSQKQSEFDQLKLVQHALSHDRNTLKSLINDKDNQIASLKSSIEKLEEAYTIQNEKMNAELELYANLENEKTNVDALVQTRNEQLEEMKALVAANQQTNEKLAEELEKHVKLKNENENLFADLIADREVSNKAFMNNLSELNDLLNVREYQLQEMTSTLSSSQESTGTLTKELENYAKELENYAKEIATEKTNREAIEQNLSDLTSIIGLREYQLEEAEGLAKSNQESKEKIAIELENYTKEIATEKTNRETIEKNLTELIALIELREQQLEETTELATSNLESNEKVANELESYIQEIALEKANRELIENKLSELTALVELREQQLQEASILATSNLEFNEKVSNELESYIQEIALEKANREELVKNLCEMTALIELREKQLEESKALCISTQESNERAFLNLEDYYSKQIENEKIYRETLEKNITNFEAHIEQRELQLEEAKSLAVLNSEFKEKAVLELASYLSEIAAEKAKREIIENNLSGLSALVELREQQLEDAKAAKKIVATELENKEINYSSEIAAEQANREAIEKNVFELATLIELREQQLEAVKTLCISNQESSEKVFSNLENYYSKKIATERENREAIEDNIIELANLIELREQQVEASKTFAISNLTLKEEIAKELENTLKTNIEKEKQYVLEITNEKAQREAFQKNINELTAQLQLRAEQFEEIKAFADQKMQINEELTDQIANLEFDNARKTQLHKKNDADIEVYTQALDQALILQDIEKNAAVQLELALNELKSLVQTKESTNQELAKVIVKQEEFSQNILQEFEQIKALSLKNEMEANTLAELLLFKEKELSELKILVKDNSINKEVELIQTANLNTKLQTQVEDLGFELNKYKQQLDEAWTTYKVAQEKTSENENQLNSLVEVLFRREHELLKLLSAEENL